MMAERKYPLDDNQSSVLDGWSLDESVEGLKSKLERWRMELPPLYDRGFSTSSHQSRSSARPTRRQADSSIGLFSCFGNVCGYECQCICGKPPGRSTNSNRFRSPAGTSGRSFL
ncbi:Calcium-dependent lipid-binding (CaLB domain) family protein [Abeliophyllum distichum]